MADEEATKPDLYDAATIDSSGVGDHLPSGREALNIRDPDADVVFYPNEERYEAKRRLGEGGMGEVHLCRDRVIGREVAMKVVLDTSPAEKPAGSPTGVKTETTRSKPEVHYRFVREARVQGQLEHPAIVPVYDFGLDADDGRPFLTMRRVRGVTLEQILDALRSGSAAAKRVHTRHKLLAAFVRVCLAIEFAHEYGVIHRDLKPANIMLGRHGEVYVLDWGLAKVRSASKSLDPRVSTAELLAGIASGADGDDDDDDTERPSNRRSEISGVSGGETKLGTILGTPQYMSPEQIRGEDIDGRADIYSLGAILFEILTFEPLQGSGPITGILQRALNGVEARASVRAPHAEVSPELEQACVRATALSRTDRYPRARELADAIEAYLSGDRDLELRRELAKVHIARARALGDGDERKALSLADRSKALQEVGRALALAPNNGDALAMLVGFLTDPPATAPPEVSARIDAAATQSARNMLPRTALAYGGTALLFIPALIAFGVRDLTLAIIPLILWLVAAMFALVSWRMSRPDRDTYPLVTFSSGLALATSSLLHGPLLVVPAIGAVMAMGQVLQTPRRNRYVLVAINVAAVGVPTLLALFGMHPIHHSFPDGALMISGGALLFSASGVALLGVMHVSFILVGSLFVGAYRTELRTLQERAQLQTWQLEQLVPAEAARAMAPPPNVGGSGRRSARTRDPALPRQG